MKQIPVVSLPQSTNEPILSGNFNIRRLQDFIGDQGMSSEPHRHSFYFILVIEKGEGDHEIDFTHYQLAHRCVFILRPGQVHQLSVKAETRGFLMQFNADFYQPKNGKVAQFFRRASHKSFCQLPEETFSRINSTLNTIFREAKEQQQGHLEAINALLDTFFIELIRNASENRPSTDKYEQERLEELQELLDKHIATEKQVSYYTGALNLSAFQLNSITKKVLGKTASELINEQVVLEARRQLLGTSNQVSQIAFSLGYDDPSYFIRFYKKHTGLTPEAYRKKFS
ncbi:AraC family transcriptional regulator [Roseivirga pacifica]|uniref:Transcriptional regulator, AraC family n=1 Tax=Roseivirga pacifica TaxID=1267423 RepID=A0A1I0QQE5_9BACT|nr:helix-turn-helix transcriptional regulator [Roseivirga pacifica]RKQ42687.1 AraC family transcriptional regulator [Roseivirga pacifica]SEW29699.1 transcriptional regulator, AraC family [Roseivirga pacifica]